MSLQGRELLQALAANRSLFNQTLGNGPAGELYVSESVKWSYTGTALSNYVFDIHFEDDPTLLSKNIEEVLNVFKKRNVPTSWIIDPFCTPNTLTSYLDTYPHASKTHFTAMVANLEDVKRPEPVAAFSVKEARSLEELELWSAVLSEGFGLGEAAKTYQRVCIQAALARGEQFTFRHFIAYQQERPVAATSLLLDGTLAGIYWVTTVPQARKQGAASVLLSQLLAYVKSEGYAWSVLQATAMGVNLYKRLGFREYYVETYYDGLQ